MGGCEGFTGLRPLGEKGGRGGKEGGGGWALDSRWELLKQEGFHFFGGYKFFETRKGMS